MTKIKKIGALVIMGTMLLGITSGCGSKTEELETITWYMPKPTGDLSHQDNVEREANKIFNEKLGVNLKFKFFDTASWEDKINLMISSGEEFDLCLTNSTTNRFDVNVTRGAFLPLNDLLDEYGSAIKSKVNDFAWEGATVDGNIYAVPGQAPYAVPKMYTFRKDLVDKYNIDYKSMKKIEDLEPYLELIKENEPGVTPLFASATGTADDEISDRYFETSIDCIRYDKEIDDFILITRDESWLKQYRVVKDYYDKGYIEKDAASKTDILTETRMGKYAVIGGTGVYSDGSKSTDFYGFPCAETLLGYNYITTNSVRKVMTAISRTSKHPEKAMQVLNLIWEDPNLSNMLAYGIEGEDYTIASGEGTDDISVIPNTGDELKWAIWHNWLGPLWDQWDSPWNSKESLIEMRERNEIAPQSPLLGFWIRQDNIKTEVAQLSAIFNESKPIIVTGSMDNFDDFVAKMEKRLIDAGADTVIETAREQYKEWKKTNN